VAASSEVASEGGAPGSAATEPEPANVAADAPASAEKPASSEAAAEPKKTDES
jgi:hypothetical protein